VDPIDDEINLVHCFSGATAKIFFPSSQRADDVVHLFGHHDEGRQQVDRSKYKISQPIIFKFRQAVLACVVS